MQIWKQGDYSRELKFDWSAFMCNLQIENKTRMSKSKTNKQNLEQCVHNTSVLKKKKSIVSLTMLTLCDA